MQAKSKLKSYASATVALFSRLGGGLGSAPPVPPTRLVILAWLGGFFAIAVVAYLSEATRYPLVLGSFGASCVLVFGFPESPFSQPRSVIGGHFIASLTGLVFITLFGSHWWSIALALATAIAAMMLTGTVHPPAGSNPVIIMLAHAGWPFLLMPTLLGVLALQAAPRGLSWFVQGQASWRTTPWHLVRSRSMQHPDTFAAPCRIPSRPSCSAGWPWTRPFKEEESGGLWCGMPGCVSSRPPTRLGFGY